MVFIDLSEFTVKKLNDPDGLCLTCGSLHKLSNWTIYFMEAVNKNLRTSLRTCCGHVLNGGGGPQQNRWFFGAFGRNSSYFDFFPSKSYGLDHSESIDMHYAYRKTIKKTPHLVWCPQNTGLCRTGEQPSWLAV